MICRAIRPPNCTARKPPTWAAEMDPYRRKLFRFVCPFATLRCLLASVQRDHWQRQGRQRQRQSQRRRPSLLDADWPTPTWCSNWSTRRARAHAHSRCSIGWQRCRWPARLPAPPGRPRQRHQPGHSQLILVRGGGMQVRLQLSLLEEQPSGLPATSPADLAHACASGCEVRGHPCCFASSSSACGV